MLGKTNMNSFNGSTCSLVCQSHGAHPSRVGGRESSYSKSLEKIGGSRGSNCRMVNVSTNPFPFELSNSTKLISISSATGVFPIVSNVYSFSVGINV